MIKMCKIRLCQEELNNGDVTCQDCEWFESGDSSVGIFEGCTHPILYDENDNVISEVESLILNCLSNPQHCILFSRKGKK
jgi:hypothetical protein